MPEFLKTMLADQFWFSIVMLAVSLGVVLGVLAPACILAERKISAWMQDRYGPNRVGPWGVLQPVADGVKFILKEDIIPANVDKVLFVIAPSIALFICVLGVAVIPWAGEIHFPWMPAGQTVKTQVLPLDIGFLFMLAAASVGVYAVVLAGYASNNKYAFYGGMRATAQMLSYEVPLGLGLLVALMIHGSLRLEVMVDEQAASGLWNVFLHPIAFLLVLVSGFAETNRAPFDLAEAEQELVGGFHTEYSAMKFAVFFLAEYANMVTSSALAVALFLGGWHIWGGPGPEDTGIVAALAKFAIFWGKVLGFIAFYMFIRWTLPRYRFDQLMRMAWKAMVPAGMAAVAMMGILVALGWHGWSPMMRLATAFGGNVLLVVIGLVVSARSKTPITGRQDYLPPVRAQRAM